MKFGHGELSEPNRDVAALRTTSTRSLARLTSLIWSC